MKELIEINKQNAMKKYEYKDLIDNLEVSLLILENGKI